MIAYMRWRYFRIQIALYTIQIVVVKYGIRSNSIVI